MRKINILHICISTFLLLAVSPSLFSSQVDQAAVSEEIGFKICQIRIHHQDLWRTLNFKIWYQSNEENAAPDTFLVKESVHQFLANYPNTTDFWEIMNTNLTTFLTTSFPSIDSLEIELSVIPDERVPTKRRSVIRYQNGKMEELFGFTHDRPSKLPNETTLEIFYHYKEGISRAEYPDFLWLSSSIDRFLEANWDSSMNWEEFKPQLMEHLMEKYPMLICVDIKQVA